MLTEANIEQVLSTISANAAALAESLAQCFDVSWTLAAGESGTWDPTLPVSGFEGQGLAVVFDVGGQGLTVLIPESLSLPAWYLTPNESQKARLDTLAMEWSMNLFLPDMEPSRYATVKVANLQEFVETCQPLHWAATMTIDVADAEQPTGSLLIVWPLLQPQFEAESPVPTPAASIPAAPVVESPAAPTGPDPLVRLRSLPVQVSVRLAEKKITVSKLLGISSGALISFPKSCEAQLDLYVNNARYCRGEAVKIGEKFGLKINEVGTTDERASKILNG